MLSKKRKLVCKVIVYPISFWILYFFVVNISDLYIFYHTPSLSEEELSISLNKENDLRLYSPTRVNHPEIYFYETESGRKFILKKIKGNSWVERFICRLLLAHEFSVLRSIRDLAFVSKLVGKVDEETFCIEYISPEENLELSLHQLLNIKEELSSILERLHERYIYHRDLAHLCNVVISSDHHSYVIDFGNAHQLDPILGHIIGPIYAYKERMRLFRMFFKIDPESLTNDEFRELLLYQSITRCFAPRSRLLNKLKEYEQYKKVNPY